MDKLQEQLLNIFKNGDHEHFEDGFESILSRDFTALISDEQHGEAALKAAASMMLNNKMHRLSPEVVGEALRWLGRLEQPLTHELRRIILESLLKDDHHYIRDGALLGLASLDDPEALPVLAECYLVEQIPELRGDIYQVILQLEKTKQG